MSQRIKAFVTPAQIEAIERFNREVQSTCAVCGKRSEAYTSWWTCRECYEMVCDDHMVDGSEDEETGRALCLECRDYAITMGETPTWK